MANASKTVQAVAAGTGPLNYRWQKDGLPLTDGGQSSGSTNSTLLISNAGTNNVGNYDCVVTGVGSPATGSPAALSRNDAVGARVEATPRRLGVAATPASPASRQRTIRCV